MKRPSRWLRRVEIVLWLGGLLLLVGAAGATYDRLHYQAEQEQAMFEAESIDPAPPAPEPSAVAPQPVEVRRVAVQPVTTFDTAPPGVDPASRSKKKTSDDVRIEARPALPLTPTAIAKRHQSELPVTRLRGSKLDPYAVGRIEIPRIGLRAIIREGAGEETLEHAVGLVPGTAHPGEMGNIVLAGHRDTFFRPLRKISVDDRIRLVVPPYSYEYRVETMRVVEPTDTTVLDRTDSEQLTLVTCYPFGFIGPAPKRFIITAARVE